MKNVLIVLVILTTSLFAQKLKIGVNSSLSTSLSEDIRNAINYTPDDQYIYLYGANFRFQPFKSIKLFTGIHSQFGNKLVARGMLPIEFTINSTDIEYIETKRKITLLVFKVPVFYSFELNESVKLNPGIYVSWSQIKFKNTGDLYMERHQKHSQINDSIHKERIFIEPAIELAFTINSYFDLNLGISYKKIEHSINSKFEIDESNIDFATEKYKYKINGLFYTIGLSVNI